MVREPVVAGQFYSSSKDALLGDLEELVPSSSEKMDAIGAVVPHAGYMCSGDVAGEVYARLKEQDTYIILGPNHTGHGDDFAATNGKWRTPLGDIEIDEVLLKSIMTETSLVTVNPIAHSFEHSIEVQVPFIQKCAPGAKIIPITIRQGSLSDFEEVAEALFLAVKSSRKKIMILSSSDMTHYESRLEAKQKDQLAIDAVLELNAEKLIDVVAKNNISMCGYMPTAVMLMAVKKLGGTKGFLVKYSDSGFVTGDTDQVVGYAGIIIS